ncbi:MAG: HlyC/CorC family transporter [Saprospiraceae bacterium]|jgi:putative hemolysin|nr:HlyC/CorC family transporter [Saprospiraceae bacterium]
MEFFIIIGLVLINGVFSMAEMSLVSSRKFKLENALKKGHKGAKTALELSENPSKFLSTVQIGITLIGILLGVYSGENLTNDVEGFLLQFESVKPFANTIAVVTIVIFVTYLSIVLGELLPKRLGLTFPEPIAMILARPMNWISVVTSPFVWLLTITNDLLLKILGIRNNMDSKVSEEEIKSIIKESADGGEIQDIEQNIVERVFELGDRKVNSLMTHCNDLIYFDEKDDLHKVRQKVGQEKHSAYPVCKDDDIDQVLGIVLLKDLFEANAESGFSLNNYLKQPLFVNETMPAYRLLELFKAERLHYGIIVDEFGATKGMVTMDDVVDALVGDVSEAHEAEYQITQRDENSWLVDGQYPISEFLRYFNLQIEKQHEGKFLTVAGLMLSRSHALPQVGDKISLDRYQLEVIDKDGQRIDKIMVTKT